MESCTIESIIRQLRNFATDRVRSKWYGDFNEDGDRNADDDAKLQDAIFSPPSTVSEARRYDLDGDNLLTSNDLTFWTLLGLP